MRDELLAGLAVFFILVIAGLFFADIKMPVVEERIIYAEEPLSKNREFSIAPGATFVYNLTGADNNSQSFSFVAAKGSNCVWLYAEGGMPVSCLKNDGTDDSGSNITLDDRSIFFFRPWMLALNDTFEWKTRGCFVINKELVCDLDFSIKVIRTEYSGGKKYYVVRLSSGQFEAYQWIEDDRRMMTREIGQDYEVILIE